MAISNELRAWLDTAATQVSEAVNGVYNMLSKQAQEAILKEAGRLQAIIGATDKSTNDANFAAKKGPEANTPKSQGPGLR